MMVTGFLRVLASGVLLLLVTTTVLVQRADASTTTSSVTPTDGSGTTSSTTPTDGTTTGTTGSDATPTDSATGTTGSDATPTDSATGTTGSDATPTDSTTDPTGSDTAPTDGTDVLCPTEVAACQEDATCISCFTSANDNSEEIDSCVDNLAEGDFETSTAACVGATAYVCCLNGISGDSCEGSTAFVEYAACVVQEVAEGCEGEITCSDIEDIVNASGGATARLGDVSTAIAFSCAFVFLLPLLWV